MSCPDTHTHTHKLTVTHRCTDPPHVHLPTCTPAHTHTDPRSPPLSVTPLFIDKRLWCCRAARIVGKSWRKVLAAASSVFHDSIGTLPTTFLPVFHLPLSLSALSTLRPSLCLGLMSTCVCVPVCVFTYCAGLFISGCMSLVNIRRSLVFLSVRGAELI